MEDEKVEEEEEEVEEEKRCAPGVTLSPEEEKKRVLSFDYREPSPSPRSPAVPGVFDTPPAVPGVFDTPPAALDTPPESRSPDSLRADPGSPFSPFSPSQDIQLPPHGPAQEEKQEEIGRAHV